MNLIRQGLKFIMTTLLSRDQILDRGPHSATGLALTFDDGPHPEYTPRVLDELQKHDIRATFFVVGKAAEAYPELTQRIVREGHTIGCHTYSHSEPSLTSSSQLLQEVRRSLALLEDLTSQRPTLFRPPKGKLTLAKTLGLWKLQQTIVLWNQDPRDYCADPQVGIQPWVDTYRPAAGDIILLHDTHPHCIAAIAPLVRLAEQHHLNHFVTVDEWLSTGRRVVRPVTEELVLQTTAAGQVHIRSEGSRT